MLSYIPITPSVNQARTALSFTSVRSLSLHTSPKLHLINACVLATFSNGESRPVFSSAQLEFIQQWLFAMQLTKEPIPLPSSDSLITREDMTSCSPQIFNDSGALKRTVKVCRCKYVWLRRSPSVRPSTRTINASKARETSSCHAGSNLSGCVRCGQRK